MKRKTLRPLARRPPLNVTFVITSMPVGGAETLLADLATSMDRRRFLPEICCLKERGPLGEQLAEHLPVESQFLRGKYDIRVISRLTRWFRQRGTDAVVTVGAGDKMFWGRLAAWRAGVPVICAALHSTGWPDSIGRLNRLLTPLTDAFVGVAAPHGEHLVERERFPAEKVVVIPNGVDTERFAPAPPSARLREALGIPAGASIVATVAALRPEKDHSLLLRAAVRILSQWPETHFLIVGDGPEGHRLQVYASELGIAPNVHFLGTRSDIAQLLCLCDVFVLCSQNEANPVSILEAMSCGRAVVATDVGSVGAIVADGETGFLVQPGDEVKLAWSVKRLLCDPGFAHSLGQAGRTRVAQQWSLQVMVRGYEDLVSKIYTSKERRQRSRGQNSGEPASAVGAGYP